MTTTVPAWNGATVPYPPNAGAVNQFLGTHSATFIYSGSVLQSSQATGSGNYVTSASTYLAQSITTGATQTIIGTVQLQVSTVGGSPITATITPLTVSLYASSIGAPTGSPLVTASLSEQYVYSGGFFITVPLAITGLTPSTTYWVVVSPAGTGTNYYVWQKSNQTSGALTSPDGVTWTAQTYGFMYEVFDLSGNLPPILFIQEDNGARVVQLNYTGTQLTGLTEATVTQSGGSVFSSRTLTYSSAGLLIGVA